jgi:hypothetical protein
MELLTGLPHPNRTKYEIGVSMCFRAQSSTLILFMRLWNYINHNQIPIIYPSKSSKRYYFARTWYWADRSILSERELVLYHRNTSIRHYYILATSVPLRQWYWWDCVRDWQCLPWYVFRRNYGSRYGEGALNACLDASWTLVIGPVKQSSSFI